GQVPPTPPTAGRGRPTASDTRSVNNLFQRRGGNPVAPADGRYSNGNPYWATTTTACDSDRKWGAMSGSARRAYAISRVRCPIPAPLLLIRSSLGRSGVARSGVPRLRVARLGVARL